MNDFTDTKLLNRAIRKTKSTTSGDLEYFSAKIADLHGMKYAIPFASKSLAMCGAINVANLIYRGPNDNVAIAVPMSATLDVWLAIQETAQSISLVDTDSQTGTICPYSLEHVIRNGSGVRIAIIDRSYGGTSSEQIKNIVNKYPMITITDASDAFGSNIEHDHGDIAVVSCGKSSILPVGGAFLLTNNEMVWDMLASPLSMPNSYISRYDMMSELSASVGLTMLKDFDNNAATRDRNRQIMVEQFDTLESNFMIEIPQTNQAVGNQLCVIVLASPGSMSEIRVSLNKNNIPHQRMYSLLSKSTIRDAFFKDVSASELRKALPGSNRVSCYGLIFPVHASWSTRETRQYASTIVSSILSSWGG